MTAEPDLLPSSVAAFTEALHGERGSLDAWLEVNDEREVRAHVEAYARANVAELQREIEALRAEVEFLRRGIVPRDDDMIVPVNLLDEINASGAEWKDRAERLAEALRDAADDIDAGVPPEDAAAHLRARADLLREQEEGYEQ